MKIIFILGSGHCGSTLVDLILDSHKKITGVGEIDSVKNGRDCACGQTVENCSFWKNVFGKSISKLKLYKSKKDFILNKNKFLLINGKKEKIDYNLEIGKNESIYKKILLKNNSDIIVDSSKNISRADFFLNNSKEDIFIIHLMRDGRAVSWSYIKKYNRFLPYAWKWFAENIKIEILKKRNKNVNCIFLNYSKFTKNPVKEFERIFKKVGVEFDFSVLRFRSGEHHQIGGNRMKFSKKEEIIEDVEWKKKMPLKYRIIFNILFGWLNFYYKIK